MKYRIIIFLNILMLLTSCTRIKVFNTEQLPSTPLRDKKILIITNDTELSQEYLIHFKNHLRLLLQKNKHETSVMNIRYKTQVKSKSVLRHPFIIFKDEPDITINARKYSKKLLQIAERSAIDNINITDSIKVIKPQIIINIDVKHEHRKVFFTLNSSTQELHGASYTITIHSTETVDPIWHGEILLENLSKMDMIPNAIKTAQKLIQILTEKNII